MSRIGQHFTSFTPAIRPKSAKSIRDRVRTWQLWRHSEKSLADIAVYINPIVQGWINYYGHYQRSHLKKVLRYLNFQLVKWIKRKYRKRGQYFKNAKKWLLANANHDPAMFAHWRIGVGL